MSSSSPRFWALSLAGWLLLALALTWPLALHPSTLLLGDPAIDVWNHAWGYWYVAEALGRGELPFHTLLAGGPGGGTLYFIDTPGALAALPLTWLGGPALGYNAVLIARIALAGLSAQLLARELGARGWGQWLAGLAYASTPFLLAELGNGISEVCAIHWVALSLWAASRAWRREGWRDYALLGVMGGLTAVVSFYQGLAAGLAVFALLGARLLQGRRWPPGLGRHLLLAGALATLLLLPVWLSFRGSLASPDALIRRGVELDMALRAHNAVDPRIYVMPGNFQSVDLAAVYGEPFLHTAYLRLSLLALAGLALWRRRERWPLLVSAGFVLVLGLGSYLWWDGGWVMLGELVLTLPFDWLQQVLPQVAITHPLRLSLPAQALVCALAGVGLQELAKRRAPLALGLGLAVLAEGLFLSAARWPLPMAPATVPSWYAGAQGMVLDLPAEVGTSMETSRYFWYQTAHGQPIPYTPDVRLGSARDPLLQELGVESPMPGSSQGLGDRLRQRYGLVVVHRDLERRAGLEGRYKQRLEPLLGPPEEHAEAWVWRLSPE